MLPLLGTFTGWRGGLRGTLRSSTGTKAKSCHRQEAPCAAWLWAALREVTWGPWEIHNEHEQKCVLAAGQQCPGKYSQGHIKDIKGRDYALIPNTPSIPHPILSLQIQERHNRSPDLVLTSMIPKHPGPLGWSGTGACAL